MKFCVFVLVQDVECSMFDDERGKMEGREERAICRPAAASGRRRMRGRRGLIA